MRTTEERANLIRRRVIQLRRERKRKRVEVLSVAACMLLVVAVGAWMPGLLSGMSTGTVETEVETASLLAIHPALGYIAMGILTFLLGVCVTVLVYRLRGYKADGERRTRMSFELLDNLFQVVLLILAALLASFLTVRYKERRFLILAMAYSCFAMGTLYWVLHIAITGDIPRVFYVAEISWVASYFFYFSIQILRQGEEHREFRFAVLPALAMAAVCGIVLYLRFVGVLSGTFALAMGGIVYLSLLRLQQKVPHPEIDVCVLLCILLQLSVYISSYFMADFTRFNLYFALDMALTCSFVALLPLTMGEVTGR